MGQVKTKTTTIEVNECSSAMMDRTIHFISAALLQADSESDRKIIIQSRLNGLCEKDSKILSVEIPGGK